MKKIYFKPEIKCHNIMPHLLDSAMSGAQGETGGGGVVEDAKINIFDGAGSDMLDGSIGDMGKDLLDIAGENDLLNLVMIKK